MFIQAIHQILVWSKKIRHILSEIDPYEEMYNYKTRKNET